MARLDTTRAGLRADQDGDRQWVVEVGAEESGAGDVAADQRVGLEDPADPHRRLTGLREFDRDHRTHVR